ncbi:MAG: transketolase [Bacteroidales bacterium]|jgi:transketolase|nr:transketolase [Bacteroidales bacterium]
MDNKTVNRAADNIRILAAAMVERAKSGHPGGAMGGADFVNMLYSEFLNYDPSDMTWVNRDRFFLDPGHMSPMLYAILTLTGNYTVEEIKNFRQWGSPTPGHPEVDVKRGVENTSGPLGQGHAMAVGAAIAEKFLQARFGEWMSHRIYAFISDGGVQEEISQGAGRLAGHLGLDNLIMFYDSNNIQLSTETKEVTSEDTGKKYEAWGWEVFTIDGNDAAQIRQALVRAQAVKGKPVLILGKTVMGKGAVTESGESYEGKCATHGMPLGEAGASFAKTVARLGGNPDDPFAIFDDVKAYYAQIREQKIQSAAAKKKQQAAWEAANPLLAAKFKKFFSGKAPDIDYASIAQKENSATRAASSTVLAHFAKNVENMIVSSADLSNSDKTDGFLKNTKALKKGDFSGAFLQAGVCELTMAAVANGIALHGGIFVACGTFFVFSDYIKPAFRLSALMELPVKYVWTHDAFRVGEDGPTHQPVEQEAQIRLMEQLKNHSGRPSALVLRPADATETSVAWKLAMENVSSPTALILSRQNIKDIPVRMGPTRYADAMQAEKGAYVAWQNADQPDLILLANGSEVATCIEGAEKLVSGKNLKIRVVAAISEGLFRLQPADYQQKVIPQNIPVLGLTAGLPVTLQGLAGPSGKVIGMESFGYSAPYKILDEKLGYTGENVYQQALKYLAKG